MMLNHQNLQDILECCSVAAKRAGEIIEKKRVEGFTVMEKTGGTSLASQVLTEADLLSQQVILDRVNDIVDRFDLGLLTEESTDDGSRFHKDFFLAIDPLDGTKPFIDKGMGYAVSIALVTKSGETVVAVVYDPVIDELFTAIKGDGVRLNGAEFIPTIHRGPLRVLTNASFPYKKYPNVERNNYGGAVMNVIQVLKGEYDIFVKPPTISSGGGSIWDYAAATLLLKEAGFIAESYTGGKLNLNRQGTTFMNEDGFLCCSNSIVKECYFSLI